MASPAQDLSPEELYQQLPPAGKKIASDPIADFTLPYQEWIQLLKSLEKLDRVSEAKKGSSRSIATALFIAAAVSLVLVITSPFLLILSGILLVAGIFFYSQGGSHGRYDLDDRLRKFLFPLLAVLRGDITKDTPVRIQLNFLPTQESRFKVGERSMPKGGRLIKGTEHVFRKDWMQIELTLSDGTFLTAKLSDVLKIRKMVKRGMSGKIKHKRKTKVKRYCQVATKFLKAQYTNVKAEGPNRESDKVLVYKNKTVEQPLKEKAIPDLDFFLAGISTAYGYVKPIK